jgi:hypothetical protein
MVPIRVSTLSGVVIEGGIAEVWAEASGPQTITLAARTAINIPAPSVILILFIVFTLSLSISHSRFLFGYKAPPEAMAVSG